LRVQRCRQITRNRFVVSIVPIAVDAAPLPDDQAPLAPIRSARSGADGALCGKMTHIGCNPGHGAIVKSPTEQKTIGEAPWSPANS